MRTNHKLHFSFWGTFWHKWGQNSIFLDPVRENNHNSKVLFQTTESSLHVPQAHINKSSSAVCEDFFYVFVITVPLLSLLLYVLHMTLQFWSHPVLVRNLSRWCYLGFRRLLFKWNPEVLLMTLFLFDFLKTFIFPLWDHMSLYIFLKQSCNYRLTNPIGILQFWITSDALLNCILFKKSLINYFNRWISQNSIPEVLQFGFKTSVLWKLFNKTFSY